LLKLIKYEILRCKFTMVALIGVLLCSEVVFLVGAAANRGATMTLGIVFLLLAAGAAFFTVWTQGLMGFIRDLTDKTGQMVFLTPVSPRRIVAVKFLVALLQLFIASGLVALFFALDIKLFYAKYETPLKIIEWVARFLGVTIAELWAAFSIAMLTGMLSTIVIYAIAYLFTAVWMAGYGTNTSGKGLRIVLMIAVFLVFMIVAILLPNISNSAGNPVVRSFIRKIPRYIFFLIGTVGCAVGTGYLLEKKISV